MESALMKLSHLSLITIVLLLSLPIFAQAPQDAVTIQTSAVTSADGIVSEVPYIWQEINGFCAWAATASAMQAAGADVDMYDVFAASTIGFSFAYFHINDTLLMFPGALYTQVEPTQFLADLYGINYTLYLGSDIPSLEQAVQVYNAGGINVGTIDGQEEAFALMRRTIDSGYPLLVSVDPLYLPIEDYLVLQEQGISGGGHGILLVGYNDTETSVTILDPGVGSFGDGYGYPLDGRGNYTKITYTALIEAWASRYWIANTFLPGGSQVQSYEDSLGKMVRDKLLGVGTIYSPNSVNAYVGHFGEKAFREMSQDMTPSGLQSFIEVFDALPREDKAALIMFIGFGLEAQVTLQYLSYRTALQALPALMPSTNLTAFLAAANQALPHFEALSDNSTLIYPGNLTQATGNVVTTFRLIAEAYNATGDLGGSIALFSTTLNQYSTELLAIADSWQAAGQALAEIWPNDFLTVYGPFIAFAGGAVAVGVVLVIWWMKKRPSQ